ncbi:hypothetical protein CSW62_00770 [Caulobacter sp. FWC2]|nr:hypothetical protein CSW62_00770 [Caulobacter sp. FWC2]
MKDHEVHFALLPSRQMRDFDLDAHRQIVGPQNFCLVQRSLAMTLMFNLRILSRKVLSKVLPRKLSDNVDYVFDESLRSGCKDIILRLNPEIVVVEYVHFSSLFDLVPDSAYRIIDTHDAFWHEFTPAAEAKGLSRADLVIAIQDREAEHFRDLLSVAGDKTKVTTVSHIVGQRERVDLSSSSGATFLGSSFEANNESLAALIENVMPIVMTKIPDFKLHVIGDVGSSVPDYPFVVKHGRVKSLTTAMALAPILANYIVKGTGIKIKLLEAMAMGVPCVSTALGADGLPPEYAEGVSIASDDASYAAELVSLFEDHSRRKRMGDAGLGAIGRWDAKQRKALKDAISSQHHRQARSLAG